MYVQYFPAEIEQIKQGIGTVTTGLAIGFDTTLLVYINEKLLP